MFLYGNKSVYDYEILCSFYFYFVYIGQSVFADNKSENRSALRSLFWREIDLKVLFTSPLRETESASFQFGTQNYDCSKFYTFLKSLSLEVIFYLVILFLCFIDETSKIANNMTNVLCILSCEQCIFGQMKSKFNISLFLQSLKIFKFY